MPNLGNLLKDEIARVARRTLKAELDALKKAGAGYRRDLAALKRQVGALERGKKGLERQLRKTTAVQEPAAGEDEGRAMRFSVKGLKTLRSRLGLSVADFGRLAAVTPQSVYNWEQGKSTPRREQLRALAELRNVGKREAKARLATAA